MGTWRRSYVKTWAEIGVVFYRPRNTKNYTSNHQKLQETRKDSFLERVERTWLCGHLHFGPLASKSVRIHFCHFKPLQNVPDFPLSGYLQLLFPP